MPDIHHRTLEIDSRDGSSDGNLFTGTNLLEDSAYNSIPTMYSKNS
jgi:hypothetical protein